MKKFLKKSIKLIIYLTNKIVSLYVVVILIGVMAIGVYKTYDTNEIYENASNEEYISYKPTTENDYSFEELQKINPETIGWVSLYGTNIDYPIAHTNNNEKYINKDIKGEFSLSGSIFLDYRNKSDFSDSYNILYGHHMKKSAMFGDIEKFMNEEFFSSHKYGNIFVNGNNYGLEIIYSFEVDAYEDGLFDPLVVIKDKNETLDKIKKLSKNEREIDINDEDKFVIFYTCSGTMTNGRYCVCARITNEIFKDSFSEEAELQKQNYLKKVSNSFNISSSYIWILMIIVSLFMEILLMVMKIVCVKLKKKGMMENKKYKRHKN